MCHRCVTTNVLFAQRDLHHCRLPGEFNRGRRGLHPQQQVSSHCFSDGVCGGNNRRMIVVFWRNSSVASPQSTAWSSTANTGNTHPPDSHMTARPPSVAFRGRLTATERTDVPMVVVQPGRPLSPSCGLQMWTSVTCCTVTRCTAAHRQQGAARRPPSLKPSTRQT